jgi:hypothetical protein
MHLPDIVGHLEDIDTASIAPTDFDYHELCQITINALRILAATPEELYKDILQDALGEETLLEIAKFCK